MNQVREIYENSFSKEIRFPWEYVLHKIKLEQIREKLHKRINEKYHLIGALLEDKLVAFFISKYFGEFAYCTFMAVDNSYRNQEIGTQVGLKVIETAKADAIEFHIRDSVLLFEIEKPDNAPNDAIKIDSERLIKFYIKKLNIIFLDIQYIEPTPILDGRDMYLAMYPFSKRNYIESDRLLSYIKRIYQLEYHLTPQKNTSKFERYMKIIHDSVNNRKKIYGINTL
ncbi:MAG TPA: GNAT family N-acetyltransferase [Candidatus Deferrimicrobium sp.]|nr:GNAT family N-acetyltransferase [Candidatus Deferrimicrobium sp.]